MGATAAIVLLAGWGLLLLAFAATAAAFAQTNNSNNNNPNKPGMVTIPLVPHHVVRARHLAEGRIENEVAVEHPTHSKYHYQNHPDHNPERMTTDATASHAAYSADQVAGLFQGYGTHYADLWCGTPPQRQTVIVDTGSGVTAFPCSGCNKCGVPDYHIDALFDGTASSTFHTLTCNECLKGSCKNNQCSIGMSYAEGSSWSAHEVQDLCYAGGFHDRPVPKDDEMQDDLDPFHAPAFAFDTKFGCQTSVTGLFKTQYVVC